LHYNNNDIFPSQNLSRAFIESWQFLGIAANKAGAPSRIVQLLHIMCFQSLIKIFVAI